jgi:hypothetical protein
MLKLPVHEILEYRQANEPILLKARDELAWLAREIESQPLTKEFDKEVDHKLMPKLRTTLSEVEKARDGWLKGEKGKLALKAAGVVVGGAATAGTLALGSAPITIAGLALWLGGFFGSNIVPGFEVIGDWKKKKAEAQGKSLRYLLMA